MGRKEAASLQVERILAQQPGQEAHPSAEQLTRAVLFTDIVGSTAYFEQRGDEAGLAMVERHNRLLLPLVDSHGGLVIKTIGDAIMASFPTAEQAAGCAVEMQRALAAHNTGQPEAERIRVRIGINFGPLLSRGADLFGDVVNAAARVEALARGGQVLISAAVQEQLPADFPVERRLHDAVRVRGKAEPVEIYELRWDPVAASSPIADRTLFEPGTLLGGRFEIVSKLGEGGMGQVYEARDRALDEIVALKFVRADLAAEAETLERFKSEVRLARSITHPNICRIHEFLEAEGRVFLSMERVRGRDLAELLADGAITDPARIEAIVVGICRGLQAAHEQGITHRDLKPANVMIEQVTDRVVLMDFGIARLTGGTGSGEDGRVVGTPEYMAPEQVRGEEVGPAADLYALGVILYQLLTGRPPFSGQTPVAVAISHLTREPEPILASNPAAPARLVAAAERCLAKAPQDRFASARELALAIGGDPDLIPPARPGRRIAALLFFGLLAAVLGVLGYLGLAGLEESGPAGQGWIAKVLVSSRAVESHARFSPDGRQLAFLRESEVWLLDADRQARRLTQGAQAIDAAGLGGLSWSRDGRELFFGRQSETGPAIQVVGLNADPPRDLVPQASAADLSPDGQRLAFCRKDAQGRSSITLSRADGSQPLCLLAGEDTRSFLQPRWSPQGDRLAIVVHHVGYDSTRDIGLLDATSGRLTMLTTDGLSHKVFNTDPTWTPDGRFLVYSSRRSGSMSLWQVPADGGPSLPLTQGSIGNRRGPDLDSTGDRIAFGTREEQMDIEMLELGTSQGRVITQDVWADRFPVFSPDGRTLAFRTQRSADDPEQRTLALIDLASSEERTLQGSPGLREFTWCGPGALIFAATVGDERLLGRLDLQTGRSEILARGFHRLWSPVCGLSGQPLVFTGMHTRSDGRDLWIYDFETRSPRRLVGDDGLHAYPALSADAQWLAYRWAPQRERLGDSELRLLRLTGGPTRPRVVTRDPTFRRSQRRLRFSASGRWIFYMEDQGDAGQLWKVRAAGGEPSAVRRVAYIHTFDFDLSPDGQWLVFPRANRIGDLYLLERQSN